MSHRHGLRVSNRHPEVVLLTHHAPEHIKRRCFTQSLIKNLRIQKLPTFDLVKLHGLQIESALLRQLLSVKTDQELDCAFEVQVTGADSGGAKLDLI